MKHLKLIIVSLVLTVLMSCGAMAASVRVINMNLTYNGRTVSYREKEVHVVVDDNELENLDMPPVIINGRTLVPLRAIFEAMGATVRWDSKTEKITADFENGDEVIMYINNKAGTMNGTAFNMDVAPMIINDRTMVPVRAIAEAVGATVGWDDATRTVNIISYVLGGDGSVSVPDNPAEEPDNSGDTNNDNSGSNDNNDNNDNNNTGNTGGSVIGSDTTQDPNKVTDLSHVDASEIDTNVSSSANEVRVTGVVANGNDTYTIKTSGNIWQYKYATVLGSKVAVDIYGGNIAVENTNMAINDAPVERIRIAQNAMEPYKIVRVVFDLTEAAGDYSVKKTTDGTGIVVSFGSGGSTGGTTTNPSSPIIGEDTDNPSTPSTGEDELGNTLNAVRRITFDDDGTNDIVTIYADETPDYNTFMLNKPYRIVVDIDDSSKNIGSLPDVIPTHYINTIRMSQFSLTSTRVVLEVSNGTEYTTTTGDGYLRIVLKKPVRSISESIINDGKTLRFTQTGNLKASAITTSYDPYTGNHIIYLNGDYSSAYGSKRLTYSNDNAQAAYISSAVFSTVNGKTRITITPSLIAEYNIYENGGYIYIDQVDPRTVYDAVVVLDAGHGGSMPGAVVNGVYEKAITLDIAKRVYNLFEGSNVKVYVTRLTDSYVDNYKRAYMANAGADMFVSIHCNTIVGNAGINGTEVLYTPHSGEGNGHLTSYQLASTLQNYVCSNAGTYNRGVKNRADLIVLNRTHVPAALIETGFMTNSKDMSLINSSSGRQAFANGIYKGIKSVISTYRLR